MESKHTANVRKQPLSKKIELGMNSLAILIGLFVLIITFAYLAYVNKNATQGYTLKELEQLHRKLTIETEVQDMRIAQMVSLQNLTQDEKVSRMIAQGDNVQFSRGDTTLALGDNSRTKE